MYIRENNQIAKQILTPKHTTSSKLDLKSESEPLKECLKKAFAIEAVKLEEELRAIEPHEFSQEFEEKMKRVVEEVEKNQD